MKCQIILYSLAVPACLRRAVFRISEVKQVFTIPSTNTAVHRNRFFPIHFYEKAGDFYDFYKSTMVYTDAEPNEAHKALAKLEKLGKLKAVVTQNIDGLHQKAGSEKVYELHGTIMKNYCMKCGQFYDLSYVMNSEGVPRCEKCGGMVKPDVVLYEEGLDDTTISKSVRAIAEADVLIIGGTSLNVYPAAGFINYYHGNKLVLINKSETPYDRQANLLDP